MSGHHQTNRPVIITVSVLTLGSAEGSTTPLPAPTPARPKPELHLSSLWDLGQQVSITKAVGCMRLTAGLRASNLRFARNAWILPSSYTIILSVSLISLPPRHACIRDPDSATLFVGYPVPWFPYIGPDQKGVVYHLEHLDRGWKIDCDYNVRAWSWKKEGEKPTPLTA